MIPWYLLNLNLAPYLLISDDSEYGDEAVIYADEEGNFTVEEFLEYDPQPTSETIRKIKKIHIPELERVRTAIGQPIVIRSASRTKRHELKQGRSGKSVHIFPRGFGAIDVSLVNFTPKTLDQLEKALIEETSYNRISRYSTFLHVDFYPTREQHRSYYRNTSRGWMYVGKIKDKNKEWKN